MNSPVATRKICLLGDFGVGKTSLVKRFVKQAFAESYQTTVGVTIETKLVSCETGEVKLVIWDIAGSNEISPVTQAYLRGAAGLLFVADGTRRSTLASVQELRRQSTELLGAVPALCLVNKLDLADAWEIDGADLDALAGAAMPALRTSARTGEHVEDAFRRLADAMTGK
ncbi:MAG: GTP-binding protein [Gammaproteobacteria bacterium]|nr:GTP-binding protein [Gammaproteobacteria bacterium]